MSTKAATGRSGAEADQVAALEDEIRQIIHTNWGPDGSRDKARARIWLDDLQRELREIAPDSQYLGHYDL